MIFDTITLSVLRTWAVTLSTIIGTSFMPSSDIIHQLNDTITVISPIVMFILKTSAILWGMYYTYRSYKHTERKSKQP